MNGGPNLPRRTSTTSPTGQSDELGNLIEGDRVEGFEPTGKLVSMDKKCD